MSAAHLKQQDSADLSSNAIWQEQLSALADGELSLHESQAFWESLDRADVRHDAQGHWASWHVAKDAMQSNACAVYSPAFLQKLNDRIAAENLSYRSAAVELVPAPKMEAVMTHVQEASNASVFRWKVAAGFASLAAVAAIGFNTLPYLGQGSQINLAQQQTQGESAMASAEQVAPVVLAENTQPQRGVASVVSLAGVNAGLPQYAAASASTTGTGIGNVMIRDARLDDLLARQYGNTTVLQPPAAFLRNANAQMVGQIAPGRN